MLRKTLFRPLRLLLQTLATLAGFGAFAPQLKHDAACCKLLYKTTYKGQLIQVPGLLGVLPKVPTPPALLSAPPRTMFRQLANDSVNNWVPRSPTRLHQGTAGESCVLPSVGEHLRLLPSRGRYQRHVYLRSQRPPRHEPCAHDGRRATLATVLRQINSRA